MQGAIASAGGARTLILGDDGVRYTFPPEEWQSDDLEPEVGMRVDFEVRGSSAADIFPMPEAAAALSAQLSPASAPAQGAAPAEPPAGKGLRTKWWRWAAAGGALLVLGVIIAAVVLGNLTSSLDNLISPNAERIAFVSDRDGDLDIYVMNPDGSDVTRLTDNSEPDRYPSWSPDGLRIAFDSDRDGNRDIYVVNADGSGATRLTDDSRKDFIPRWSPDGPRIAFSSGGWGKWVYVVNADGSGLTQLTAPRLTGGQVTGTQAGPRTAGGSPF